MCWYKPLLQPLAARFIAGETTREAIQYGKKIQKKGITPIFDILGESASTREDAVRVSEAYIQLLDEMKRNYVNGAISLKLTAFAMEKDEETCLRAVTRVVRHARGMNTLVWIDMESSPYTSETLKIYKKLIEEYPNVGICIQAYLKRARKDILSLLTYKNAKIRVVKGVYPEPSALVYTTHKQITQHYKEIVNLLSQKDAWTAVGTHDMELISHTLGLPFPRHLEFQMLKGLKDHEKKMLAEHGYNVCEYVPFGSHWEKYVVRRVGERLRNVKWIVQSWFGQ